MKFVPKGVCSKLIDIEMEGSVVKKVAFTGGCEGNLKGIAALVENKDASEVIGVLKGITCGRKPTSCPDQLSKALEELLVSQEKC